MTFWLAVPVLALGVTAAAAVAGGIFLTARHIQMFFQVILRTGAALRVQVVTGCERLMTVDPSALDPRRAGKWPDAPPPRPTGLVPEMVSAETLAAIEAALIPFAGKDGSGMPGNPATLARLLLEPPLTDDFSAADMVHACFGSMPDGGARSGALLAVAVNLAAHFGRPTNLPMATTRAWRMLDRHFAETEMAAQLAAIARFIEDWQKNQQTFLCLDFSEIELIELMFESLHPGRHTAILAEVMSFKVLSNRRQGILRRIPHRTRKIMAEARSGTADARDYLEGTRTFLERIVTTHSHLPIIEAAATALAEIDKTIEAARPAAVEPPAPQGQSLARITPVKRPAAELAAEAAGLPAALAPPPPQVSEPIPAPAARAVTVAAPGPNLCSRASLAGLLSPPHFTIRTPWGRIGLRMLGTTPARRNTPVGLTTLSRPQTLKMVSGSPQPAAHPPTVTAAVSTAPPAQPAALPAPAAADNRRSVRGGRKTRISAESKRQAALRVLHGENPSMIAQSLGVDRAKLDEWVAKFVVAGAAAFSSSRKISPGSAEFLRAKLAEVLTTVQMIERAMNVDNPRQPVKLVSSRHSGRLSG